MAPSKLLVATKRRCGNFAARVIELSQYSIGRPMHIHWVGL